VLETLARARFREADWGPLLEDVARSTGPDTATRTLDALLARARVPLGARGRLLLADGDRLSAAGRAPAAEARYAQVVGLVPDSLEGQQAQVRVLRALAAQTDSMPDLVAVRARLGRLGQGAAAGEARALGVERAARPELLLFARVAPPVPGPRGPMLDPPPVGTLAAAPPASPAVDGARGAPRPSGKRDDGPVHRPRPADQPTPRDSL